MINVLFSAGKANWGDYQRPLQKAFKDAGLTIDLRTDHTPKDTDYIIYAPSSPLQDFTGFTNCKAVLSLWAGVEKIVANPTLTQTLCRMVDPGLTQGMVEWVTGHALRYHLDIDRYLGAQQARWEPKFPPLAADRRVAVLGLGALGKACATALREIGFNVSGWARSQKDIQGITCFSGLEGFNQILEQAEIIVLLLPDTPETENTLNADAFSKLTPGAKIINPGRGTLIDDDALLNALESGQVAHATLDVFRIEPLPTEHPYWDHPKVTVTPHIAAETRASTASHVIAENIRRGEAGEPFLHEVNRASGY